MRKLIVLLITLLPILSFSQKMVNGFGVEAFLGKTYNSPNEFMKLNYHGEQYQLQMTGETDVFGGTVYIPFDMGIKRHRFIIAPGIEYRTAKISINPHPEIQTPDNTYSTIFLNSTTYTPLVQVLYRPHFYLGRLHMSFSLGANFKYTVYGSFELTGNDNAAFVDLKNMADGEEMDYGNNYPAQRLRDLNFHIDPRLGLDFYIGNSFMISLFGIVPDVSSIGKAGIAWEAGAGITYLIKTNKITEAKILQQYKK